MRKENEMQFVDTNEQPLKPSDNQNYSPVPNYSPNDGSSSSRLINTRMVRIRYETKFVFCNSEKRNYQINTISCIDDNNPQNENEGPLFEAELAIPFCCPQPPQLNINDAQTNGLVRVAALMENQLNNMIVIVVEKKLILNIQI